MYEDGVQWVNRRIQIAPAYRRIWIAKAKLMWKVAAGLLEGCDDFTSAKRMYETLHDREMVEY